MIAFLGQRGFSNVREVEVMPENVRFALPPEIVAAIGRLLKHQGWSKIDGSDSSAIDFNSLWKDLRPGCAACEFDPDGAEVSLSRQHEDGWWCGELEADTTLESDYIFLHTVLGTRNERRFQQCAEEILRHQNEDGGWPIYQGGPSNVTAA